ncbi:alpha-1,4-glucan--maltose-1-phosphate maltosyltransferase [Pedobacter sp. SYSU D00535]|uniref:alpha-1,4-glucan--maltose-1-phosphate maltosyltransferase n=1 Tax=Pedobacter sp. SYSU D00535 TaxID=2810308 RepID=UPI001A97093B|nr:alpha-1,4-glucan--maltose-1-phosphate maltosyltransferase [Pedobacter sp. SYSU D00535]
MINSDGRKRVIITNVSPAIEGGQFPAKAAIHEEVIISADIFSDGHDEVGAAVLVRLKDQDNWTELPMKFVINDHWEAILQPEQLGFYQFQVKGWIDHYTTWKKGLVKKFDANQDIRVELLIGAELLEKTLATSSESDKAALQQYASRLRGDESPDLLVALATSNEVAQLMYRLRDKTLDTLYPHIFDVEIERKKAGFSSWYEFFPRSAAAEPGKHGTFKDAARLLPRVAKMGFDVIYFPPIHPIGEINRKGKNNSLVAEPGEPGSPWAIGNRLGGHKDIHPELGSLADFKDLLEQAKAYDIEIAMDIAYQCAPDHPYVKEHPQWFKWRPDGTVQYAENPPKKYEDILPINFESEDWENLWQELKSVIDYWIEQGVSIFRVDNPHTKAFPFWQWMIGEVRKAHPEIIFLAEAFTRPRIMERLAKIGFSQSYTYFTWRNTKYELEEYITELTKTERRYYFRPNFWPNTPDILPPFLTYGGENAHILRLLLAATMSANYGLYGPVYEFGLNTPRPGKEEYIDNEKYEIWHWDWDKYTRIKDIITRINRIRKEHSAFHTTYNLELISTSNDQIFCFAKIDKKSGQHFIVVANLDVHNTQGAHVQVPLNLLGLTAGQPYLVHDLLSGSRYRWVDDWNYVELNPFEMPVHVFRVELK